MSKAKYEVTENKLCLGPDLCGCFTLDQVEARLRQEYRGWFVYRGGRHVALHRQWGDNERLFLAVDRHSDQERE